MCPLTSDREMSTKNLKTKILSLMHENADISHMILQCMTVIYNFLVFRKIKWMAISIALHGSSSLCSTII